MKETTSPTMKPILTLLTVLLLAPLAALHAADATTAGLEVLEPAERGWTVIEFPVSRKSLQSSRMPASACKRTGRERKCVSTTCA